MIVWINRDLSRGWYRISFLNEISNHIDVTLVTNKVQQSCVMTQVPVGDGKVFGQRFTDHELANKSYSVTYHGRLLRTLFALAPDTLICEGFFRWSLYALFFKLVRPKTKLVMLYERTDYTERSAQLVRTIYRKFFLRYCDLVVCSGQACRNYVKRLDRRVSITVGHMCADTKRFSSLPRKTGEIIKLVYVGRLEDRKGVLPFLQAFVSTQPKNLSLDIIGEGVLRPKLEALAAGTLNVKLHPQVSNEVLPKFLIQYDILVLPSIEDNWALVGFEGIASGLAFATSTKNGASFEFKTNEALKFNPTKPAAIKNFIERIEAMSPLEVDSLKSRGHSKAVRYETAMVAREFSRSIKNLRPHPAEEGS